MQDTQKLYDNIAEKDAGHWASIESIIKIRGGVAIALRDISRLQIVSKYSRSVYLLRKCDMTHDEIASW